jgi:hypothetical protein
MLVPVLNKQRMKEIVSVMTLLIITSCNPSNQNSVNLGEIDRPTENVDSVKTEFSIELVGSKNFIKNDTTYFKLLPHNVASVSLKPKRPGMMLQFHNEMYMAYIKDLDTLFIEVIEMNKETGIMQDTTVFKFITDDKE